MARRYNRSNKRLKAKTHGTKMTKTVRESEPSILPLQTSHPFPFTFHSREERPTQSSRFLRLEKRNKRNSFRRVEKNTGRRKQL